MHWSYRIIAHEEMDGVTLAIHEVHYNKDGQPVMVTERAAVVLGETPEVLKEVLQMMEGALSKPILYGTQGNKFLKEYTNDHNTKD